MLAKRPDGQRQARAVAVRGVVRGVVGVVALPGVEHEENGHVVACGEVADLVGLPAFQVELVHASVTDYVPRLLEPRLLDVVARRAVLGDWVHEEVVPVITGVVLPGGHEQVGVRPIARPELVHDRLRKVRESWQEHNCKLRPHGTGTTGE